MKKMESLVYITGSGRSGSTLLDMLLSTHPDVAALGEVHRFSMNIGRNSVPYRCTCGETIEECKFWRAVIDKLISENVDPYSLKTTWKINENIGVNHDGTNIVENIPVRTLLNSKINLFNLFLSLGLENVVTMLSPIVGTFSEGKKISENSWLLYEKICEVHDRRVLVDGTKTPGRLLALMAFNAHKIPVKIIYLCRDGRAVTHARMKRQGLSMRDSAKIWVTEHKKISIALKKYKETPLNVKYEELCSNTEGILQQIFHYIGVHERSKHALFRESSHSLGGNPMRLRKSERVIKINEKWKDELTRKDLVDFEEIGGGINRKLGYE